MLKVAILGLGNRGRIYAYQLSKNKDARIVALCEKNADVLEAKRQDFGVPKSAAFTSDEEFFAAGKLADAVVIATQDRDHYGHAMKALEVGYHILLEKPVSPVLEECHTLYKTAKEKNLHVVVCHVLRYAPFYNKIKEVIDSGAIGDIVGINQTENVGYWHYSHSYVRGNWRKESETSPSILAKCCHDLDIIYYFTGKKCVSVNSYGSRKLFLPENAPEGSTPYCLDGCPHRKECPYDVLKIYYGVTRYTIPYMIVNKLLITKKAGASLKEFREVLKTSPYGRCVYRCDNDVMENQVVNMNLENNITATLTMTAFSKQCFRRIHIYGTKGEIFGNDKDGKFRLSIFGGPNKKVKVGFAGVAGHLGGDRMIIKDFVDFLDKGVKNPRLSLLETTLESHTTALLAEESRKAGGKKIIKE
ncbi:MAG: Gfo/Idh/MocA family oxidoreductase [Clostridiales bacterium]|jgi:predicted dehydrogenase|nr:Gfo/Idh/MocA family oxidoreductase [Clostridiales bacterium]HOB63863.1 Gfo/Idh/MocA family oxidoreductase [Clostridia bacterium]HOK81862.1 Gfo/Idh/MocA family oxidoreductase [Clostridia bacterium]HOL60905.1 Gfo/Idh/MocA family oxidoreductase [Clostridia bacterium]HPO53589.1 Gfo/Idh/MocA family oxidoreductase [Clostridia bacterium]